MPVYEFSIVAKVNIRMDGPTPEMAAANLESLLEDSQMSIPNFGIGIKVGNYPAEVWFQANPPKLEKQMPDTFTDPTQPLPQMTMKRWMEICLGDPDDMEEAEVKLSPEASEQVREMLARAEGAKGQDLPLADKQALLDKIKKD